MCSPAVVVATDSRGLLSAVSGYLVTINDRPHTLMFTLWSFGTCRNSIQQYDAAESQLK